MGRLVLGLGLVKYDNSHRGYDCNVQEDGKDTFHGTVEEDFKISIKSTVGLPTTASSLGDIQVEDNVDTKMMKFQ